MFDGAKILVTGGTGSFGRTFVPMLLGRFNPSRVVILSRDEMKQWDMAPEFAGDPRVRFFIGDVRDRDRLFRAFKGIDYVVLDKIVQRCTTHLNASKRTLMVR